MAVKRNANGYRIGETHHKARYTDHEIELVRQLRIDGWKIVEISSKMGMSKGYVSFVVRHLRR